MHLRGAASRLGCGRFPSRRRGVSRIRAHVSSGCLFHRVVSVEHLSYAEPILYYGGSHSPRATCDGEMARPYGIPFMFHYPLFAPSSHGSTPREASQNVVICRRLRRLSQSAVICWKLLKSVEYCRRTSQSVVNGIFPKPASPPDPDAVLLE